MPGNFANILTKEESVSDMKQEYEEEDLLEIVDNLKQEEQAAEDTDTWNQHIQSGDENFVSVLDGAESSID